MKKLGIYGMLIGIGGLILDKNRNNETFIGKRKNLYIAIIALGALNTIIESNKVK